MRWLTGLFRVPELDKYSDDEYDRLVIQAKLRRGDAIWVLPGLCGLCAAALWGVAAYMLGAAVMTSTGGTPPLGSLERWVRLTIVVGIGVFCAVFFSVRYLLVIRSIRHIVNKTGCPYCEFSLVGLTVEHGAVKCPECGSRVVLADHRINPDDLWVRAAKFAGAGKRGAYKGVDSKAEFEKRPKAAAAPVKKAGSAGAGPSRKGPK